MLLAIPYTERPEHIILNFSIVTSTVPHIQQLQELHLGRYNETDIVNGSKSAYFMGRAERQRPGTMPDRAKAPIRIHTPYPAVCLPRARQPAPPFLVRGALSGREVLKVVQVAKEALEASSLDLPLDLALSPTLLLGDTAPAASEQLAQLHAPHEHAKGEHSGEDGDAAEQSNSDEQHEHALRLLRGGRAIARVARPAVGADAVPRRVAARGLASPSPRARAVEGVAFVIIAHRAEQLLGQQFARRSAVCGLAEARTRARANSALFATAHARPARAAWAWDAAVGTLVRRVADALIPYALAVARAEVGAAGRHVTRLAAPKLFAQALGRADTPAVT